MMTKHDDLLRQLDRADDDVMREAAELIRKYEREAAAPDLLFLLKDLYALVQGEAPSLLEDSHLDIAICEAIAKATTETEAV